MASGIDVSVVPASRPVRRPASSAPLVFALSVSCFSGVLLLEHFFAGWSLLVPGAVIFLYLLVALWLGQDADDFNAAADDVFIIGYLCMLASVCAWGLKVWRDVHVLEKPEVVAVALAMSLLATVCGLIAMTTLRAHARAFHKTQDAADFGVAMERLISAISASELPIAVRQLVADIKDAPNSLQRLREVSAQTESTINLFTNKLASATEKANNYLGNLSCRLEHIHTETSKQLSGATEKANNYLVAVSGRLAEIDAEIVKVNTALAKFNTLLGDESKEFKQLREAVRQVEQVLHAFVRLEQLRNDLESLQATGSHS